MNQDEVLFVTDVILLRKAILQNYSIEDFLFGNLNTDTILTITDVILLRTTDFTGCFRKTQVGASQKVRQLLFNAEMFERGLFYDFMD